MINQLSDLEEDLLSIGEINRQILFEYKSSNISSMMYFNKLNDSSIRLSVNNEQGSTNINATEDTCTILYKSTCFLKPTFGVGVSPDNYSFSFTAGFPKYLQEIFYKISFLSDNFNLRNSEHALSFLSSHNFKNCQFGMHLLLFPVIGASFDFLLPQYQFLIHSDLQSTKMNVNSSIKFNFNQFHSTLYENLCYIPSSYISIFTHQNDPKKINDFQDGYINLLRLGYYFKTKNKQSFFNYWGGFELKKAKTNFLLFNIKLGCKCNNFHVGYRVSQKNNGIKYCTGLKYKSKKNGEFTVLLAKRPSKSKQLKLKWNGSLFDYDINASLLFKEKLIPNFAFTFSFYD